MGVLDVLRGAATVAGQGYAGYAVDEKNSVAQALAQAKASQDAERNRVLNLVSKAGIDPTTQGNIAGARATAEVPAAVQRAQALAPISVQTAVDTAKGTAPIRTQQAIDTAAGTAGTQQATHAANRDYDVAHTAPVQPSYSPVVTTAPGGEQHVSTLNTKTGALSDTGAQAKAGGPSIPAGIRSKVAENVSTLATIDEAMQSLTKHPDAVGLTKNLPLVGKYADQRLDPEGVATRALIANVGSLQIHTRTGANMNIREEPRLAPFVPDASDTPDAIRTKLTQLAKFLTIENDALVGGPPAPHAGGTPPAAGHQSLSDEEFAKQWKAGKRSWP